MSRATIWLRHLEESHYLGECLKEFTSVHNVVLIFVENEVVFWSGIEKLNKIVKLMSAVMF